MTDETKTIENMCNCDDEFKTFPCPVHSKHPDNKPNKERGIVIMDDRIVEMNPMRWVGYCFSCPTCERHIMHDMCFCSGCGQKILVKSKIVTDSINQLETQK